MQPLSVHPDAEARLRDEAKAQAKRGDVEMMTRVRVALAQSATLREDSLLRILAVDNGKHHIIGRKDPLEEYEKKHGRVRAMKTHTDHATTYVGASETGIPWVVALDDGKLYLIEHKVTTRNALLSGDLHALEAAVKRGRGIGTLRPILRPPRIRSDAYLANKATNKSTKRKRKSDEITGAAEEGERPAKKAKKAEEGERPAKRARKKKEKKVDDDVVVDAMPVVRMALPPPPSPAMTRSALPATVLELATSDNVTALCAQGYAQRDRTLMQPCAALVPEMLRLAAAHRMATLAAAFMDTDEDGRRLLIKIEELATQRVMDVSNQLPAQTPEMIQHLLEACGEELGQIQGRPLYATPIGE